MNRKAKSAGSQPLLAAGVEFPEEHLVATPDEFEPVLPAITFPVVLKAMGLVHRTDIGGVRLCITKVDELPSRYAAMIEALAPPTVTIERMVDTSTGVELIVGVRGDERLGLSPWSVGEAFSTEVHDDVATALAPVEQDGALRLLTSLRSAALLAGVRGRPAVDIEAVPRQVVPITAFACAHPENTDVEVNPLLATPQGAIAIDARAVPTNGLTSETRSTSSTDLNAQ